MQKTTQNRYYRRELGKLGLGDATVMVEKIATAWVVMHTAKKGSPQYEENFWAFEDLNELCYDDPFQGLAVIQQILRTDSSDIILSHVGAGPMETLLAQHGEKVIDQVEENAATDAHFRRMLGAIWQNNMTPDIWARLKRVAGPPF